MSLRRGNRRRGRSERKIVKQSINKKHIDTSTKIKSLLTLLKSKNA